MAQTKHSKMFDKIDKYYHMGIWTEHMVRNAVLKGKITPEEFNEITGEVYEED